MQNLLDNVGAIHHKYQKLEKQEGFNIFSVLRSHSDEVRVHSRFIAELLNPKGSHGQGTLFLNLFLNELEFPHSSYTKA
ncbi:PD-(D/E)XK nuclease family protein [Pontibacter sp. HSC-14F20]|nr:PD-(D/E)XK nuclease family protein [Pontibacter sp. HSC-14F20]